MLARFVLFDGFDPMDVIGPLEVFNAARTCTDQVTIELACVAPVPAAGTAEWPR